MSLYNMMLGHQPSATLALLLLKITPDHVPRFRDAYVTLEGDEPRVVLYTRTGGGNREEYAADNARLRALPGFLRDVDDTFDCTYAYFHYEVPEEFRARIKEKLLAHGIPKTPTERMQEVIAAMQEKTRD